MPIYSFALRDGSPTMRDEEGIRLPDRKHARDYALKVVGELMWRRERQTRSWCLDVYEGHGKLVFTIPFASVDSTLDHLSPALRATVERRCELSRQLAEATYTASVTVREARAVVARARGKPYLAVHAGEATIRSSQ